MTKTYAINMMTYRTAKRISNSSRRASTAVKFNKTSSVKKNEKK